MIQNPDFSQTTSACPGGIKVRISKGNDVWESPDVLPNNLYQAGTDRWATTTSGFEFMLRGEPHWILEATCNNGIATGSLKLRMTSFKYYEHAYISDHSTTPELPKYDVISRVEPVPYVLVGGP